MSFEYSEDCLTNYHDHRLDPNKFRTWNLTMIIKTDEV